MIEILYEDNHLIAINKRSGDLVQGDATGDETLADKVKSYLKEKYNKPGAVFLGVIHRLDRPVSGVVVFAKTSKALSRMNALFQKRETQKTYWALTSKVPSPRSGTLIHWLVKDEKKNKTTAYKKENPEGLRSELSYTLIQERGDFFLLEILPVTGRPHQIRVQLATIGCPIVGDLKYGFPNANPDGSICLHARYLEFIHPVSKVKIELSAPLPDNPLWNFYR